MGNGTHYLYIILMHVNLVIVLKGLGSGPTNFTAFITRQMSLGSIVFKQNYYLALPPL
jgi:hypothetical protein